MSERRSSAVRVVLVATMVAAVAAWTPSGAQEPEAPGTFSILGYDPATGEVGGAIQSRSFSVGSRNIWAEADVGAVVTQATGNISYGPQALALLKNGLSPAAIVKQLWDNDPDPLPETWSKHGRQFAVMNAKGEYAAFTGTKANQWAGHKGGKYCTAQGNILVGEAVVNGMVDAFEKSTGHLSMRLLAAIEGGQAAGGDKRGQQSAAIYIVKKGAGATLYNDTVVRLHVEDHAEPIKELRRLIEKWAATRPKPLLP
jgi:uncharacterized Ntn-hydrolase superfamily protein